MSLESGRRWGLRRVLCPREGLYWQMLITKIWRKKSFLTLSFPSLSLSGVEGRLLPSSHRGHCSSLPRRLSKPPCPALPLLSHQVNPQVWWTLTFPFLCASCGATADSPLPPLPLPAFLFLHPLFPPSSFPSYSSSLPHSSPSFTRLPPLFFPPVPPFPCFSLLLLFLFRILKK